MQHRRYRLARAGLVVGTVAAIAVVTAWVFPYHSINHDEAVYLQQAAMLQAGTLFLEPPVPEAFRPWFFVADGQTLYPKYSPVPAAMFALGDLVGSYRLALPALGASAVALTTRLGRELFDARTGLIAGLLFLASPLFVVQASVFLPYVPTMTLELAFALAYLLAVRRADPRYGLLAGLAIGLAFFARPYTALLFGLPFVLHASWLTASGDRDIRLTTVSVAIVGSLGVGVALAYNAVVTGDPSVFPYEAFAPRDGLGFGRREILAHSLEYTPALALRSNAEVLWVFFTRWAPAGIVGVALAAGGALLVARRDTDSMHLVVGGIVPSVALGNLFFWGNRNILGALDTAGDGLIHYLGPYYHVDLLVPIALFGAVGLRVALGQVRELARAHVNADARTGFTAVAVTCLLLATLAGGLVVAPLSDNAEITDTYEEAYAPFEAQDFDHALVFLPTPYGDWLHHPFQALRNSPRYDGRLVTALDERQFAVIDAFPDRTLYRYSYRGDWAPTAGSTVEPRLERIHHVRGSAVRTTANAGVPAQSAFLTIELASDADRTTASAQPDGNLTLQTTVTGDNATLSSPALNQSLRVPVRENDTVATRVFVDYGTGAGVTYRLEQPVQTTGDRVRTITPRTELCVGADRCGAGAAITGSSLPAGIGLNVTVRETA
jgi:4-amino-4-deoxy-L-arabinose transferase-like glycosyltransferase